MYKSDVFIPLDNDRQQITFKKLNNVRKSFLQLKKSVRFEICKPETKKQKKERIKNKKLRECKTLNLGSYASSFAILNTKIDKKQGSLVITAGHVCGNEEIVKSLIEYDMSFDDLELSFKARDLDDDQYDVKVLNVDIRNDICLLFVEGFNKGIVPLTRHKLTPGERVWNVASPVAEFHKGMVPVFEGYYSGIDEGGKGSYTIPAAPGSSGSPIINSYGELVGVLVSIHSEMNHLSYSPSLIVVYDFIIRSCDTCNIRYNIVNNQLQSLDLEKR